MSGEETLQIELEVDLKALLAYNQGKAFYQIYANEVRKQQMYGLRHNVFDFPQVANRSCGEGSRGRSSTRGSLPAGAAQDDSAGPLH